GGNAEVSHEDAAALPRMVALDRGVDDGERARVLLRDAATIVRGRISADDRVNQRQRSGVPDAAAIALRRARLDDAIRQRQRTAGVDERRKRRAVPNGAAIGEHEGDDRGRTVLDGDVLNGYDDVGACRVRMEDPIDAASVHDGGRGALAEDGQIVADIEVTR